MHEKTSKGASANPLLAPSLIFQSRDLRPAGRRSLSLFLSLALSLAVESSPSALDSFALDLETVVVLLVSIDHFHM